MIVNKLKKVLLISCSISIIVSMLFISTFAESKETDDVGDIVSESLVTAQSNQTIYLGDKSGHTFKDLMIVKNNITYLPIRLAFTGESKETVIEGIRTAVEPYMNEPSIRIGVQYEKNGKTMRKQVCLNWFDSKTIEKLNSDGTGRTYFEMGIVPSGYDSEGNWIENEPYGKMVFYEAGEQIGTDSHGYKLFKPTIPKDRLWYEPFEALPIIQQVGSNGEARVYIPLNNFNDMVQYLVGDTNYHVEKKS